VGRKQPLGFPRLLYFRVPRPAIRVFQTVPLCEILQGDAVLAIVRRGSFFPFYTSFPVANPYRSSRPSFFVPFQILCGYLSKLSLTLFPLRLLSVQYGPRQSGIFESLRGPVRPRSEIECQHLSSSHLCLTLTSLFFGSVFSLSASAGGRSGFSAPPSLRHSVWMHPCW